MKENGNLLLENSRKIASAAKKESLAMMLIGASVTGIYGQTNS